MSGTHNTSYAEKFKTTVPQEEKDRRNAEAREVRETLRREAQERRLNRR